MLRALPSPSSGALRDGNQRAISQISGGLKDGSTSHTHPASQSTNPEPQTHKDQWDQGVWESHRSSVFLSPALRAPQVPSTAGNIHGTGIKLKIPARKTILNSSSDVALLNKKSRRNHSTSQPDSQHERDEGVPPPPIPNDTDKETGKSRSIQRFFPPPGANLHRVRKSRELSRGGVLKMSQPFQHSRHSLGELGIFKSSFLISALFCCLAPWGKREESSMLRML